MTPGLEPGNLYFKTHLCSLFQYVSVAVSGRHTKLNQSLCIRQILHHSSLCLKPRTHQHEAQNPQNNQNVGLRPMLPQWRPTAAQLLKRFLRRSSETCFLLLELQTFIPLPPPQPAPAVLKSNNHLQLLAEDTVGAPPLGAAPHR